MAALATSVPTSLGAQFRRHFRAYAIGTILLGAYQTLTYLFDRGLQLGTDAALSGERDVALRVGCALVVAALAAACVRVLSRIYIFNGGRNVEYDLKKALLERLHMLGPAYFRRMSTGEIMSRATNDATQV